jgi:hypothetical protein
MAIGCLGFLAVFASLWVAISLAGGSPGIALLGAAGGLVACAFAGRGVLVAIGPRPRLWADRTSVEAGETFRVRWEVASRFTEARSIVVTWEGREVAIEQGGYGPTFYRATFASRVVNSEMGPPAGTASVALPQLLMPSFAAHTARIEWLVRARLNIRRWPNVSAEYLIEVLPGRWDRP